MDARLSDLLQRGDRLSRKSRAEFNPYQVSIQLLGEGAVALSGRGLQSSERGALRHLWRRLPVPLSSAMAVRLSFKIATSLIALWYDRFWCEAGAFESASAPQAHSS
jgi:hypothetical protein